MAKRKRELESKRVGALPIVNELLERLDLENILSRYLPREKRRGRRPAVPPEKVLLVLLRNLVLRKDPLYGIPDWVRSHVPELFGLKEAHLGSLGDDRLARALDLLYEADSSRLLTRVILQAVREYRVRLKEIHNDTTTVTFSGRYARQKFQVGTIFLRRGKNKDHRPDLKQLVFSVSTSADGDIPVHYRAFAGNTNDDQIHTEIWSDLRDFIGHSDFVYVADSKLCTRSNMHFIDSQKGKFVTVLPRTRKEDGEFRSWVQDHRIPWEGEKKLPNPRRKNDPPHIFRVYEWPWRSSEGYRIIWVWDSLKAAHDALVRKERTDRARE
nr:IS1634 family transposase [Thermoplasmata archaeon]NIY03531.1 IS1634 family transposase [Thermoplasmata archaeon]